MQVHQEDLFITRQLARFVESNANNMRDTRENPLISFFGNQRYFYLAVVATVPLFIISETFVQRIGVPEDEAAAVAISICIIAGVFTGRHLAQIQLRRNPVASAGILFGLGLLILLGIAWLFFHADFPLKDRVAINLFLYWLPLVIISIALGILIKLVRSVSERQLREAQAAAAQSKEELQLLQSQLSPHFLFNTLNNLYGLSITQHEKLPPLLLKLAELLRYSVYEANANYVPLRDELAYIHNYIAFEKIRLGDRLVLKNDITTLFEDDIVIAPMLLIILLENAFKHARDTPDQKIYISISLSAWGNSVLFSVKNSCSPASPASLRPASNGLGLVNLRKRLDLLYPGKHELILEQQDDTYSAHLQLKITKNA